MDKQERRKSKRYPVEVPVQITEHLKGKRFSMLTRDVSTSGVFIRTRRTKKFPVGTSVSLTFIPATSPDPIYVNGEVVRVIDKSSAKKSRQESGLGIMFFNLDEVDVETIETCILVDVAPLDEEQE